MSRTQPPTDEQLDHLVGHTDHRPLSPTEVAALRAGIQRLRRQRGGNNSADNARRGIAETRIALALAVLNGTPPDNAKHLAHEIREALTTPNLESTR